MEFNSVYLLAFAGGFVPGALWLFFWMLEDRRHPEPKRLIALSFCVGVLSVPLALFAQRLFVEAVIAPRSLTDYINNMPLAGAAALFAFAAIEEVCKLMAAYAAALWSKEVDEPIDYIIYLIAAALGFAAYETALFVFTPFSDGAIWQGLVMGNLRAVGAMLLHVVASSVIGLSLAFAFYRSNRVRLWRGFLGLLVATVLHGIFNLAIMKSEGNNAVFAFVSVWVSIVILLVMFERAKKVHPTFSH